MSGHCWQGWVQCRCGVRSGSGCEARDASDLADDLGCHQRADAVDLHQRRAGGGHEQADALLDGAKPGSKMPAPAGGRPIPPLERSGAPWQPARAAGTAAIRINFGSRRSRAETWRGDRSSLGSAKTARRSTTSCTERSTVARSSGVPARAGAQLRACSRKLWRQCAAESLNQPAKSDSIATRLVGWRRSDPGSSSPPTRTTSATSVFASSLPSAI